MRDAAEYIERNLWALAHLGSNFAAWRLYYLENDSTDDTRRLLDGFRNKFPMHVAGLMMDGASTQPSAFLCPPIFSKLNCLERTGLLAALRQRLLTFVLHDPTHEHRGVRSHPDCAHAKRAARLHGGLRGSAARRRGEARMDE